MHVTWHPLARAEMIDAAQFYSARDPRVGAEFLNAVDAATRTVGVGEGVAVGGGTTAVTVSVSVGDVTVPLCAAATLVTLPALRSACVMV